MKVGAIVLCYVTMYQDPAFFANAAGTIHQEEVQVTIVSIEWRQTMRIHICILNLTLISDSIVHFN